VAQGKVVNGEGAEIQPGKHRSLLADMIQQAQQVAGAS
jgi:hypothetical protein